MLSVVVLHVRVNKVLNEVEFSTLTTCESEVCVFRNEQLNEKCDGLKNNEQSVSEASRIWIIWV